MIQDIGDRDFTEFRDFTAY